MRILSYLNVSNLSNLEADSGFIFQRTLLAALAERGHEVVLVGPHDMPGLPDSVEAIEIEISQSKFGVRFGFPWLNLERKLIGRASTFGFLLVNQSELTIPVATLINELRDTRIPCATYFHYLAVEGITDHTPIFDPSQDYYGTAPFIWQRQVESALFSDAVIIGSDFGRELFLRASGRRRDIEDKCFVIFPPVQRSKPLSPSFNIKPILLYNHRLYNHYGGIRLFELLRQVYEQHPFTLLVTDPTSGRSQHRDRLDGSVRTIKAYLMDLEFAEVRHFATQEAYQEELGRIDLGLAPLRTGALWSIAVADVMAAGRPVVAPRRDCFPELVGDNDLLYDDEEEFRAVVGTLLSNREVLRRKGQEAAARTDHLRAECAAKAFERVFEHLENGTVRR